MKYPPIFLCIVSFVTTAVAVPQPSPPPPKPMPAVRHHNPFPPSPPSSHHRPLPPSPPPSHHRPLPSSSSPRRHNFLLPVPDRHHHSPLPPAPDRHHHRPLPPHSPRLWWSGVPFGIYSIQSVPASYIYGDAYVAYDSALLEPDGSLILEMGGEVDRKTFAKLGIGLTCDPVRKIKVRRD